MEERDATELGEVAPASSFCLLQPLWGQLPVLEALQCVLILITIPRRWS